MKPTQSSTNPDIQIPPTPVTPPPACKAFVTSETFTGGEVGGIEGGDAICARLIGATGYTSTRKWKAWLSTTDDSGATAYSPATDFVRCSQGYELLDAEGTSIATSFIDLIDAALSNAINVDENGMVLMTNPGMEEMAEDSSWTGTSPTGEAATNNCDNWSTVERQWPIWTTG